MLRVGGLDFYEFKPSFGKWYYKDWVGFREDKKKHTKSHWFRMCVEFLEGGYKIYYVAQNDDLVFFVVVAPGGRRLKCTSHSDYVFGPYYTAECYRGKGMATKALTEILSWNDFHNSNVYSYIQKENVASLKVVEKCGATIIGQAIMKGFLRRLHSAEVGVFYIVKYERNWTMYKNVSVFIFGANGRQVLPVCKGFYELGCRVICFCKSKFSTGYLTKYATEKILYENVMQKKEDFFSCAERMIRENRYDLIVPLGDNGAIYLSQRKEELSKYSNIAVNDWSVFQFACDKLNTMRICQEYGIHAPKTLLSDDPISEMKNGILEFPVVVKPRTAVGSIGFQIIQSMEKLEVYWHSYDNHNGPLLLQEYVVQGDNPQYRADLFRDRDGVFRMAMVGKVTRWYPLDGGSGIFAYTIHDEEIIENCKRLLDAIQWNGYANIDMVWDEKEHKAKILEINGRTGATIKLDYIAGANVSQLILENELGLPVTDMLEYQDNHKMSCFLPDILWFVKSKNRFKTNPSWFDRKGVKDSIFSWDDPLPAFGFVLNSVFSFREAMNKRRRTK